jgi:recombinational DNA repair protein (RecF pathway)
MQNKGMSRRISESDAVKIMKAVGIKPLVPYTNTNTAWESMCLKCKKIIFPRLASIKSGSKGCAYCSGKKVDPKDALTIMQEAGYEPMTPYPGNDVPWKSQCKKCKRETFPRFHGVKSRGDGCKYCSGNIILPVDALKDMDEKGLIPLVEFPGASKPWKSQCKKCGAQNSPRLADLRMGHSGCKQCGNEAGGKKRRLINNPTRAGKTTLYEEVLAVMLNASLEPLEQYTTSQTKWKCKCLKCGAVVKPTYNQIKQGSGGCLACSRLEQIGRGKLDESAAIAIMRGKNLQPLEPYPGAMIPWKVKCLDCGNFANPRYAHIQQGRKGCKQCGYNKNADSHRTSQSEAFSTARAAGFEPLEPYKGRHFPWNCKCMKCGEEISPHYSGIVSGGGCRYCSGLVVDPIEATKVMKKALIKTLVPYPGAGKPWLSECLKCKKEIKPRYSSVNKGIGGCKYCATHGYDFSKGGILYLITNETLNSHKIGITNDGAKEKRLEKHLKKGWKTYRTQFYVDGNRAFEVEQEILVWWRNDLGLQSYLSNSEMPQGGFTETVDASEIDLLTVWSYIEEISKKLEDRKLPVPTPKTSMPKKQKKRTTKSGL